MAGAARGAAAGAPGAAAGPRVARVFAELAAEVPFVAPEVLERAAGAPFRARLGANELARGPSPAALAAMRAACARAGLYGDPSSEALRGELARRLRVPERAVWVGSGIDDLMNQVVRLVVEPGDPVVSSRGGYPTFDFHVRASGGRLVHVPYRPDFVQDLPALGAAAREARAKLVYVSNPDNPMGTWNSGAAIQELLDRHLPGDCMLLLDEAYAEFAPQGAVLPYADPTSDPRLVRLRTFSKAYGLAGSRIGYGVACPEAVVGHIHKFRQHFGVNGVAQAGALASLLDADGRLGEVVADNRRGREQYAALCDRLGLGHLASGANFVAIDLGSEPRASALLEALRTRGVWVRKPGVPPLDRFVRVSVGSEAERQVFEEELPGALEDIAGLA